MMMAMSNDFCHLFRHVEVISLDIPRLEWRVPFGTALETSCAPCFVLRSVTGLERMNRKTMPCARFDMFVYQQRRPDGSSGHRALHEAAGCFVDFGRFRATGPEMLLRE